MDPVRLTAKIRVAFAPCCLGRWPTPLEPAPELGAACGVAALAIKREDCSAPECGGNKVRGLEFLFAGAAPGTVFVTVGAIGSTHCLATAVHAARVSCRAALAQFPQPETPVSRVVARAALAHATLVERTRRTLTLPMAVARVWHRAGALGPRRWIPGGGAHPRAVIGHMLAGLELGAQLAEAPEAIVVPLGTGGTVAGLGLALAALTWPTVVVGVRVAPAVVANRWRAAALGRGARRLLARRGIGLPRARPPLVVDGLGAGYGWPTPAGERARELAARHGLALDPCYGAKALAAIPAVAAQGYRRVVFWHTFGAALPELEREP